MDAVCIPQRFTVVRINTQQSALCAHDDFSPLFAADEQRSIPGRTHTARLPHLFASQFVQGDERAAFDARIDEQHLSEQDRRAT